MRKAAAKPLILLLLLGLILLPSRALCEGDRLVVVSIETLALIVREVGGDRVRVEVLVPEDIEPHALQFTSEMLNKARKAMLLVLTGHFAFEENLIEQINTPYTTLEDYLKTGLKLLEIPGSGLNIHGYWLHPQNAIAIARAVAEKLKAIDPSFGEYYEKNFRAFEIKMGKLMEYLNTSIIKNLGLKYVKVVIAFPAAQYIANALGMKSAAFLSRGGEALIGGSDLIAIEEKLRSGEYKLIIAPDIIAETQIGKYIEQIARETGAPIAYVKTVGGGGMNSYMELLMHNVGVIVGALKAGEIAPPRTERYRGELTWLETLLIIVVIALSIALAIETWIIVWRI